MAYALANPAEPPVVRVHEVRNVGWVRRCVVLGGSRGSLQDVVGEQRVELCVSPLRRRRVTVPDRVYPVALPGVLGDDHGVAAAGPDPRDRVRVDVQLRPAVPGRQGQLLLGLHVLGPRHGRLDNVAHEPVGDGERGRCQHGHREGGEHEDEPSAAAVPGRAGLRPLEPGIGLERRDAVEQIGFVHRRRLRHRVRLAQSENGGVGSHVPSTSS